MIYEFVAKIRYIKNTVNLNLEEIDRFVQEIGESLEKPLQIEVLFSDDKAEKDILVKSEVSVSSFPSFHSDEFNAATDNFKRYLEEIAYKFDGEISKTDGFYNNSKTFGKLYE